MISQLVIRRTQVYSSSWECVPSCKYTKNSVFTVHENDPTWQVILRMKLTTVSDCFFSKPTTEDNDEDVDGSEDVASWTTTPKQIINSNPFYV